MGKNSKNNSGTTTVAKGSPTTKSASSPIITTPVITATPAKASVVAAAASPSTPLVATNAHPQPVATRNNHAKMMGKSSTPATPLTRGTTTNDGFPSESSGGHDAKRIGGNRPGEFKMPACNNNRAAFNKKNAVCASSSSSFCAIQVLVDLFKTVVVPMGGAVGVVYAYQLAQQDAVMSARVANAVLQLATSPFIASAAASVPAIQQAKDFIISALVSPSSTATPLLNAINIVFIQNALFALFGLVMARFTIKLFAMLMRGDNNNQKKPIDSKSTASGFDSDENNRSGMKKPFAMPRIKKEKDPEIVALRATEYSRLDRDNHCYLDYTGGMLYPESLVRRHCDQLLKGTYGNPHSSNPTSFASTELCEKARADVLKFFNADPEEYLCIFTSNASGALRIVGESFPFVEDSQYLLLMDNHNSVNGIREFAISRGAKVTYARTNTSLRIDDDVLEKLLEKTYGDDSAPKLFAYPAQSNFSGVKHSLEWVERAQQLGWYTLLDAAAFVPTSPLDLSAVHPDFVSMSFYKIFGYPTGIGALLMRKRCVGIMQRPWFAGGTIKFVTCASENGGNSASSNANNSNNNGGAGEAEHHHKHTKNSPSGDLTYTRPAAENGDDAGNKDSNDSLNVFARDPMHVLAHDHEAFEDGTINYLSLSAISYGLEFMTKLDMKKVSGHVQAITSDLIDALSGLVHSNGQPMINILGPNSSYKRGGTVSINVVDVHGDIIPPVVVEKLANEQMISIRSGCFCNPGDSEILFPEAWRAMMEILEEGDPLKAREMGLGIAAAIRISVGIPTSDADVGRVIKFLSSFKNAVKDNYMHLMVCSNPHGGGSGGNGDVYHI